MTAMLPAVNENVVSRDTKINKLGNSAKSKLLDAALEYAGRGWAIFPCRSNKTPFTDNGVWDATTDQGQIERWWKRWPEANIGLNAGMSNLLVFDLDPGHSLAAFHNAIGGEVKTLLRAKTPRGGEHLFYALDPKDPAVAPSTSKVSPNVDVRSHGSYVLLAPSHTKDDGTGHCVEGDYAWQGPADAKPAYRTEGMIRACAAARSKHAERDSWIIDPDLPANVAAATEWLKNVAKPAVEGQGGDNTAYATMAMLRSYGISAEVALDLFLDHYNGRCSPPWGEDDIPYLQAKIEHANDFATSPPGNMTEAYQRARKAELFKAVERREVTEDAAGETLDRPGFEATSGKFRFIDRGALEAVKPPEWIVEGVLPEGAFAMLIGPHGTYKTFLALSLALSIASPPLRRKDLEASINPWAKLIRSRGNVLIAVGEGRGGMQKRVKAWEQTHNKGAEVDLIIADPVPNVNEDWTKFLAGAKAARPEGYRLCVIDTVGRAMQGVNENAQEHASKLTKLAEDIQRTLGTQDGTPCAVLAIHHTGHEEKRARGSSVFGADADTLLTVEKAGEMMVGLGMTKQKEAEEMKRPIMFQMREVETSPEQKSLVAVATDAQAEAQATGKAESKASLFQDHTAIQSLAILDQEVMKVLRSNPSREWTDRALADTVATNTAGGFKLKTLQDTKAKVTLLALRHSSGTASRDFYSVDKKRWQGRPGM